MSEKVRRILIIFIVIILVGLIGLSLLLVSNYSKKKKEEKPNDSETILKQFSYNGYTYDLYPDWKFSVPEDQTFKKFLLDKISGQSGAVVYLFDYSRIGTLEDVYSDFTPLKERLAEVDIKVQNGKVMTIAGTKTIALEGYYNDFETLLAFIPAYSHYMYYIYLTAGGNGGMIFDYDSLETVINILNTAIKEK